MELIQRATELWDWLRALDAPFAFLLALPFLVALAALTGEWICHRFGRDVHA